VISEELRPSEETPSDSAFQQLDTQNPGMVNQLTTAPDVASPDSKLVKILKYHVVGQR
jgi:hypothetical protein